MRRVTRPGGVLLVSTRDYDQARQLHPTGTPPQVWVAPGGPVSVAFQVWDWRGDAPVVSAANEVEVLQVVVISAVARESLLTYLRDCPGRAPRMEVRAVAGKFELYKDASGSYRFRLKASNGQVIAVGEAYESKASALNGIESVRKNAGDAALDDQTD